MTPVVDGTPAPPRPGGLSPGCWGCLAVVAIAAYGLFRLANPSDWVEVTFRNLPQGTREPYLVADRPGGLRIMSPYVSMVLPFPLPVRLGQQSGQGTDGGPVTDSVQWVEGRRYGLIARLDDGSWRLWWLGPDDLRRPLFIRHLVGGGEASVRTPDPEKAKILTEDEVRRLDSSFGPPR
jgi:hypothetical protein